MTTLDLSGDTLILRWRQNDPVNITLIALDVDWSGTYKSEIRRLRPKGSVNHGELLGEFTVTAQHIGADTEFVLSISEADSADIPTGRWLFDMQETGGSTRFSGFCEVLEDVTVFP